MCRFFRLQVIVVAGLLGALAASITSSAAAETLANAAYRLEVTPTTGGVSRCAFRQDHELALGGRPLSLPRRTSNREKPSRKPPASAMRESRSPATS